MLKSFICFMSLKEQQSLWSLNSIYDHWETVLHHASETTTDTQHSNDMTWQYLKIWRLCACDTASMCLTVIRADTVLQESSFSVYYYYYSNTVICVYYPRWIRALRGSGLIQHNFFFPVQWLRRWAGLTPIHTLQELYYLLIYLSLCHWMIRQNTGETGTSSWFKHRPCYFLVIWHWSL